MSNRFKLSDNDREILKETLNLFGVEQIELSNKLNINQSGLSQLLRGRTKSVNLEYFTKIIDFLVDVVKSSDKIKEKDLDNQFYKIAGFLSRFSNSAKDLIPVKNFPPSEIIPTSAKNYLERVYDEEILDALQDLPFTLIISGPSQTGKSSLLASLENTAREKKIPTLWFDPKQAIPYNTKIEQSELNKLLVESLASQLEREWGFELPTSDDEDPIDTLPNLIHWIKTTLMPTRFTPRILIIDDLGRLGMAAVEDWLRTFVRELNNERAKSGATDALSFAIGVSYGYNDGINAAALLISSIVSWSTEIVVEWLEEEEVVELAKKMDVPLPQNTNLYDLFNGHVYLTNVALYDKDFLDSNIKWKNKKSETTARPIRGAKAYKLLLNATRRMILGPVWNMPKENKEVLRTLSSIYKGKSEKPRRDHTKFLIEAKFLNEDNTPTMDLYRLVVEDLIEEIDGENNG